MTGRELTAFEERRDGLVEQGVPEDLATRVAVLQPGVHAARHRRDRRPRGPRPGSRWRGCTSRSASGSACPAVVQRILALPRDDRWQTMARAALRDDLYAVHAQLTAQVLLATSPEDSVPARIAAWEDDDEVVVGRAVGHARGDLRRRLRPTWPGCRSGCGWSAGCSRPDEPTSGPTAPASPRPSPHHVGGGHRPVAVAEAALDADRSRDPRLNAFSVVLADEARAEADRARRAAGRRASTPGPLHGVPIAIKEEIDVAGRGDDVRRRGQLHAGRRRRRGGPPAARGGRGRRRQDDDAGVRRLPLHRVGLARASPATRGTRPAPPAAPAAVRRPRSPRAWCRSGMGGDGGGSIRIPSACCGLFGLKPQRGRVTTAPQPHLWWALGTAGPLTRSVLDSAIVYDVIRGNVDGDLYRAGEAGSFVEAAGREPGRLRIGWSTKPVAARRPPGPDPRARASRTPPGCSPTSATTCARSTRATPTRRAAFVPQFFAGIRTESDAGRALRPARAADPPDLPDGLVGDAAGASTGRSAQTEQVSAQGQPGLRRLSTCCSPRRSRTARRRSASSTASGTVGSALALDAGDRVRRALERRRQPGRLRAVRARPRRPPDVGPAGRPHRRRDHAARACPPSSSRPGPGRLVAR